MTYGLGEWGLGLWGATADLALESVVALTTHAVLVTVSQPVLMDSLLGDGDALNPATWTVARADNSYTWTVTAVQPLSDRRFVLHLRTALHSANRTHKVDARRLQSAAGIAISDPFMLEFRGVLPATDVTEPTGPTDFESTDIQGGGLRTTEAGSYAKIYGDDVIRKMILRRLTTMPGSYFHIPAADFGRDLQIKEPLRASSLSSLKVKIDNEIMKEPNVVAANCSLSYVNGVLQIRAKVQTEYGTIETDISAG